MNEIILLLVLFNAVLAITILTRMSRRAASPTEPRFKAQYVLDTSAIIDGRIYEVAQAGFLPGEFIIPEFVLAELQHIADSARDLRRARGRFGLDMVQQLQSVAKTEVRITDWDTTQTTAVDEKLIILAKEYSAFIVTTDFNLNKLAAIQNVTVLNVNELAHSLRPAKLPGERLRLKLVQKGSDRGQAVGYLADGTMIVVEQAAGRVGQEVEVEASRIMQTVAGKMMFARLVRTSTPKIAPRRNRQSTKSGGNTDEPTVQG